jgi:DNA-directed RNA polymerase I, II, and III subunit RPABC5
MIIPVRCFTCGKVLANKYDYYLQSVADLEAAKKTEERASLEKKRETKGQKEAAAKASAEKEKESVATRHFDTVRTGHIMDAMGLTRYCCRRHMLATVDMMEII